MTDFDAQSIKEEQQKIIEENLKTLPESKRLAKEREQQLIEQLLQDDNKTKKPHFGILFPSIIIIGTLLILIVFITVIHLLLAIF